MAKVEVGKNKFNIKATYYTGSLSYSTGEFSAYNLQQCDISNDMITILATNDFKGYVTDYIPVNEILDYTLSFVSDNDNISVIVCAYNKNYTFLDSIHITDSSEREIHFRTPEDTRYVRISFEEHIRNSAVRFSMIQLEEGLDKTEWEPYKETIIEVYGVFREDIYNWMKETLSPNLTKGDLDIIVRLMCYIFGDLDGMTQTLKDQIDPDKAEETYLRHLCTVIGYEWNEALTADQQRESIKMFIDIRRRRGSIWSLENLIKVFGQDTTSFYSSSDLRGVKIIEYRPNAWDGINLHNTASDTLGKKLKQTTGEIIDSENTFVTSFIDIYALDANWKYYNTGLNSSYFGAFYDRNQDIISTFPLSNNGVLNVPEGAEYVRFTVKTANRDTFRVERESITDANNLYPGDLMIEVPQFSNILRFAIDNIRLIGTRIVFAYMIYVGVFKMLTTINAGREIHQFFDPAYWGYDPIIKTWGPQDENTVIGTITDWQISHRVKNAVTNFSASIYLGHKKPYDKGFVLHETGDDNYKGFLVDDATLHDDHSMYGDV